MARNKTVFLYNNAAGTTHIQNWSIQFGGGTVTYAVGSERKTFPINLSGDAAIVFTVDDTVSLTASYNYASDTWTSETSSPDQIRFNVSQSAITVTSSVTRA